MTTFLLATCSGNSKKQPFPYNNIDLAHVQLSFSLAKIHCARFDALNKQRKLSLHFTPINFDGCFVRGNFQDYIQITIQFSQAECIASTLE